MMRFDQLPEYARELLALWAILLLLFLYYVFARFIQQKRRKEQFFLTGLLVVADYGLMQVMLTFMKGEHGETLDRGFALPVWLSVLLLTVFTAVAGLLQCNIIRWRRTHITPRSVRQSMDHLPAGLCYSWPGGLPKLTNDRMDALCRTITGMPLGDADAFWSALREGLVQTDLTSIQTGENPIVRLPDGGVYSFRRTKLALEGQPVYELLAVDVTEEYAVSLELREKQKRADQVNRRLRGLNQTITAMTVEKETLTAKTQLHDELGTLLLTAKRYLCAPDSVDRNDLLNQWQRVNGMLQNEGPNDLQEAYIDVVRSAYLLGVEVEIYGVLPEVGAPRDLTALAMSACLTNTHRHAGGTRLFVRCEHREGAYHISIQNNGRLPEAPITEGGGLGDLRRRVERFGGTMRVESRPRFDLTMTIPEEGSTHGERTDRG
ncbi:MAG: hypothetical protein IJ792_03945 [Oscillospiraceae bacterium]|nr:hypothetical protein [Oscillospiraceae bacterium]